MSNADYKELIPHTKACGYYVYIDKHPTIEIKLSSKLGYLSLIFLTIGILRIGSENHWKLGAINLFVGLSFGISQQIWKENRKKLKLKIRKFKIKKEGIEIVGIDKKTNFIDKDNIISF